MMLPFIRRSVLALASFALLGATACGRDASPEPKPAPGAPPTATSPAAPAASDLPLLAPEELARILAGPGDKPLLFHVGFKKLYQQAHIPGSEFLGPGADDEALERLRQRVADLPRTADIVIYCGCCPWKHCPNVKPAYEVLRELGFTHARVLDIPQDLGVDWVARGFPVARGE